MKPAPQSVKNEVMFQPDCITCVFPECDGASVSWYRHPDETMTEFVQRVKREKQEVIDNWD